MRAARALPTRVSTNIPIHRALVAGEGATHVVERHASY
jgi:hypothetical protein